MEFQKGSIFCCYINVCTFNQKDIIVLFIYGFVWLRYKTNTKYLCQFSDLVNFVSNKRLIHFY